jgi:ABC-2 type transport system ATP-binding protein
MSAPAVVEARGVTFAHGDRQVLDGVDLELAAGRTFGIVGPDGAGKSTLLRLMIGQLIPDAGTLRVLGLDPTDREVRRHVAYMPQSFGQYVDLSVDENLEFFAELHGLMDDAARALIGDLLARTGLIEFRKRRGAQLSGGMMQKLALACALVSRPRVMFLDEPTTGVDPASRRAFWQLLDQVRAEGVAIVCATANLDEAERCDTVGLLVRGRFARLGSPRDLVAGFDELLFEVTGAGARARRNDLRAIELVDLVFPVGDSLKVWLRNPADAATFRATLAGIGPLLEAHGRRPSLHDVALRDLALEDRCDGRTPRQRH